MLVDVETLAVTRALAQFSDDVYRIQTGLLRGAQAAPYEPTALRAQTYLNRLAYKQAIASYLYDWKALVATVGLKQLPLTEIGGKVDRFFPYYEYDAVLAYAKLNHTDILTAQNGVKKAQYLLKLAQVTPIFQDLDLYLSMEKTFAVPPFGQYQTIVLGLPLSIWDQNKGNIVAAQGALVRAGEESHRVEVTLANNLATAYTGYRNNLYAMEYYRKNILPDLVRYYRGIHARRQIDPSSAFGDLVAAEQMLSSSVSSYITILGNLWTSAVGVADFLQTDDLYQVAKRHELPELPDFNQLRHWACDHVALAASATQSSRSGDKTAKVPDDASNAQTAGGMEAHQDAARRRVPQRDDAAQTAAWVQEQPRPSGPTGTPATQVLRIPPRLPGSEAPEIHISTQRTAAEIEPHISGSPPPAG